MEDFAKPRRALPPLYRVIAATALFAVVPALASWTLRSVGAVSGASGIALAAVASLVLFSFGGFYWQRCRSSSDVLFGELLIWGWVRRTIINRRLPVVMSQLGLGTDDARHTSIDLSREQRLELFRRLAADLEASDPYTEGHSRRVARYATLMGAHMRLGREELAQIRTAALLHDVGKLYTPREILVKPGRLTDEEFAVIKRHPTAGARLVKLLLGDEQLASIVLHHHERIDGTGYPSSLTGELIPVGARIIAVADTFDAITSRRPYRPAMPHKTALDILRQEAGTQLDPAAVRAFIAVYSGGRSRGALAAFSGVAEGAIPSLTSSGAALAGIAAGAAALGGGGLAVAQAQRPREPAVASATAHPRGPITGADTRRFPGARTTTAHNSRHHLRPGTKSRARTPAGLPTDPRPKPGGGGRGAPVRPVGSAGGSTGATTYGGDTPPSSHGGGASGGGGGGGGGGDPVTVTTSGSGAGVTVNAGGATLTAGSTVSTSTTNPGAATNVGAGAGGAGAGASASGSGGASAGVTVTTPGLPPTAVTTPSAGASP